MENEFFKKVAEKKLDGTLIKKAYHFAKKAHEGQKRVGGADFFTHLEAVANILLEQQCTDIDTTTIATALLHDTLEDTETSVATLEYEFSKEIAKLVHAVSKIDQQDGKTNRPATHAKWLEEGRKDKRVFHIKLADIMHNLMTLESLPQSQQKRMALEAIAFHVPIAKRMKLSKFEYDIKRLAETYLGA